MIDRQLVDVLRNQRNDLIQLIVANGHPLGRDDGNKDRGNHKQVHSGLPRTTGPIAGAQIAPQVL